MSHLTIRVHVPCICKLEPQCVQDSHFSSELQTLENGKFGAKLVVLFFDTTGYVYSTVQEILLIPSQLSL